MAKPRQKTTARMAAQGAARSKSAALRIFGRGGYNGARRERPAMREWNPWIGGPNGDTLPDLPALRARSADLERNAPLATGVINTNITSTVGTGVIPMARIDRAFLGLSDDDADAWEEDAERIFDSVASTTALDLADRLDFWSMQSLALRSQLVRGDIFAIRRMVARPGSLLDTRVQMIEADRVSNPIGALDTTRFMGGVEFDENGVQVRIHVRDSHPGEWSGSFVWIPEPVYGPETGQRRVLHVMDWTRIDQARGVPYLAPVMEALKQLDRYSEAEVMAAVVNSFFAVFITSQAGDETDDFQDMGNPETLAAMRGIPGNANDVRLKPGMMMGLAPGESIQQTNTSRPNPQFDPFVQAILRQIGVALEVPFEMLIKHFTSSYSASRAAIIEAWRSTIRRRNWLVSVFCQPIWEWIIEEAVARGLLKAPGFFDNPLVRRAYCGTEWTGPAMGSLDPLSDVEAAERRAELGLSTLQQETAQMNGGDWLRNHRQRVKEHRMRVRDGLDQQEVATTRITEQQPPPPADAHDDAEEEDFEDAGDSSDGSSKKTTSSSGSSAKARPLRARGKRVSYAAQQRQREREDERELVHA